MDANYLRNKEDYMTEAITANVKSEWGGGGGDWGCWMNRAMGLRQG
jgi:hypothetical protein